MYHRFSFGGMAGYVYTLIGFLALVVGADAKTSVTPATKEVGRGGVSYQVTVSSDTDWKASTVSTTARLGSSRNRVAIGAFLFIIKRFGEGFLARRKERAQTADGAFITIKI